MKKAIEKILVINRFLINFEIPRILLVFIVILMIVSALGKAFSAGLFIPFLNSLQNIEAVSTQNNKALNFILYLFSGVKMEYRFIYILLTILLLMSAVEILTILVNRFSLKFSMFMVQDKVSNRLFRDILNARLKFFYKQNSGSLINHITANVNRSYKCINCFMKMVYQGLFCFAYILIALLILPVYTGWLVFVIAGFLLLFKKLLPYLYSIGFANYAAQENANNLIVEAMQGVRSIILSCAQKDYRKNFKDVMHTYYSTIFNSSWISQNLPLFVRMLSLVLIALILFFNKQRFLQGNQASFSQFIFFIYVASSIFQHLGSINATHSTFAFCYEGMVALLKLDTELKVFKTEVFPATLRINKFEKGIKVQNMGFSYNADHKILNELEFDITIKQKVAFVGSSGSGKSTLIDILSGFHDDYLGSIQVNGKELRDIDKNDWRNLLGYVSQETFIFNDTVRNNLNFGFKREITDEEMIQACKSAQIYEMITSLKEGFNTRLGERGVRLSGGEKQRLAIARLFLKNPQIVVLDEATSSLDSASEKKVKEALDILGEGRTMIAVAHRLSTVSDYEQIYVLEKGRIVESGRHLDLINRKGYYYSYYNIQSMKGDRGK